MFRYVQRNAAQTFDQQLYVIITFLLLFLNTIRVLQIEIIFFCIYCCLCILINLLRHVIVIDVVVNYTKDTELTVK